MNIILKIIILTGAVLTIPLPAFACAVSDRACVIERLSKSAEQIDNERWRDQTYREIAKTKAFDGDIDGAIAMIKIIKTPDTQAMTIRGIGMAVADKNITGKAYDDVFTKLRVEAQKIEHPPSYAIALTYIAMAQAFAGDDNGAWKTASEMENEALRNKAYGETAEIQAEKGKYDEAIKSISFIQINSFRDKAYAHVSQILAENNFLQKSLNAAEKISNPYKRATAIQFVLDTQTPREIAKKKN